jgi:HlyD family secretion protein
MYGVLKSCGKGVSEMKAKRPIVVGIIILIIIAGVLTYYFRNRKDTGVLTLSGNIEVTEANVGFKLPGRIVELAVDEGDMVKAGQVLARIDSAELASVVMQNRASLQEAMTRLSELKAGSRIQEIERAQANANAQAADFERAKKDFERADILYKNGAISASQFDASLSAFNAKMAQYRSAQETTSLVKEGPRKEDIQAAEYRVQQMKAMVNTSEERLKDTTLNAPISGVIIRKNVELGETLGAGMPALTIGDLENPWVKVYVKEDRLGQVKFGQKAEIKVDSFKNKTYEGTVTFISSEAEFTPKNVQTEEERVKLVFGVKVKVKNENGELKPGMPADVKILLQ